ncbi:MAG: DUF2344 domain-containing protein [Candidatus Omnitrophica bacterium]|nr:DUF2344 domain-containing protein [Candidatus Omnitrophota bacterium]
MATKMRAVFAKQGPMRFISHLDLMRLFQRALRRAGLPVTLTKGFSPHLKISIAKALKLGVESPSEEATFYMEKRVEPEEFKESINKQLPDGVKVVAAQEI